MKIAVLSDIHGNFQALDAVMNDIKLNNCEKVLCLGDLAMAGPQPEEVIDFVKNQNNWEIIQGNTDKMIAEFTPEIINAMKDKFPVMANALSDDVNILDEDYKEFLRGLPEQKSLEFGGVKILMVHGSPRKNNEDILPDLPVEKVEEMIGETSADMIFCGHTHVPCGYQTTKKQTVVNVGSVGRPMTKNPQACYCILNVNKGNFSIEHRLVDYDKETASNLMKERGFDGSNELAQMILHPTERHI